MSFDAERARLAAKYTARIHAATTKTASVPDHAEALADGGFLTEISGRVILTAPAKSLTTVSDVPPEMALAWEKASEANPYFQWIQGRFVEAEKANRNGAFWSTEDLEFGEMSVKHGPLNWLHEGRKVVGTIADNALIRPGLLPGVSTSSMSDITTWAATSGFSNMVLSNGTTSTTINLAAGPARPYIAAVSAVWRWLYPDEARVIAKASEEGSLYYSMECVAAQMQCVESAESDGCGKSFDYFTAMKSPGETCEHIVERSSVRRMVQPSFLGGAVIVPPTRPGWTGANAEVMRQAAALAAEVAPADAQTSQWEQLMAAVLAYAT